MSHKKKIWYSVSILLIAAILLGLYQVQLLRTAHSSFDNYYKFRGCTELVERAETYARCKLPSGEIIKLVNVGDRWFLDGDLGW
jgi:hypothetical protein